MKDKKFKTFSVIRLSFAVLMIGEALFLIYCAVSDIFISEPSISRTAALVLTCTPFVVTLIYSFLSAFYTSGKIAKVFTLLIFGAAISFAAAAALSFWPLEILLLAAMAVSGVILASHGLAKSKITFPYGTMCLGVMYFNLCTLPRLFYDYSGMDLLEILLSAVFVTVICAFMIADLALSARREKSQGHITS